MDPTPHRATGGEDMDVEKKGRTPAKQPSRHAARFGLAEGRRRSGRQGERGKKPRRGKAGLLWPNPKP